MHCQPKTQHFCLTTVNLPKALGAGVTGTLGVREGIVVFIVVAAVESQYSHCGGKITEHLHDPVSRNSLLLKVPFILAFHTNGQ